MDWRTTASSQAQQDLDSLLRDSVNAAADRLADQDTFTPFMLTIGIDGDRNFRTTTSNTGPDETSVITALQTPDDRHQIRARAVALDVTAREPISGDAIKVLLEHSEGIAIDVLVPYRITADNVAVDMTAANAAAATVRLWA